MLTEERRHQFKQDVAAAKLKGDSGQADRWTRVVGLALMVVGVAGALLGYNVSLDQDDLRDIASSQILATAMAALAVAGGALYVAGTLSRVLRLWLLRQLIESQLHVDQLEEAVQRPRL